jgi:hypothetical protein
MLEGAAMYALFVKMIPYVLGMKVISGVVEVGVHVVKTQISKRA